MIFVVIIFIVLISLRVFSSKIKGAVGETKVNVRLKFLGDEYIVLKDLLIQNKSGHTSQIDEIIISEYGIFVVETKHYNGWFFGYEKYEYWTQVIFKEKYSFRNPIKQNYSHIYALKDILSYIPNIKYYPIIVFSGNAILKNIVSTVPVIYDNMLIDTIKSLSSEKCISAEDVVKIKTILETSNIIDKTARKEHVKNIKQAISEKQIKINNNICPKCKGELKLINGKNGKFYGCSNYPNCKFTTTYSSRP
ncbi:MAG: NERD domain-containing protein [Spirochaetaceae bacterium]|nr:NERD domain-containing protein [Spirochaetaceae bacterium]